MSLKTRIINISNRPIAPLIIILLSLITSMTFCFLLFPKLSGSLNLILDPDRHGPLGYGIWKNHSLSYYPDKTVTVARGPLYPAFIALTLAVSNGAWPIAPQVGQCIIFSLTCLLAFWTASKLWNRPIGFVVSTICAFHPLLFWYTSRIWVESLTIFMFTAMTASVVYLSLRPTLWRSILLGFVIGAGALCKGVFLPYIVVVPLLFSVLKPKKLKPAYFLAIFIAALAVITPWTIRNYTLTNKIIPVASATGFNCQVGDHWIEDYNKSPFSLSDLWNMNINEIRAMASEAPRGLTGPQREVWLDKMYLQKSLDHYKREPVFLLKKVAIGSWLFWSLGETPSKTAALAVQQITLLVLCLLCAWRFRREKFPTIRSVVGVLIAVLFLSYLPILSEARYSVVLIPTMVIYAAGILVPYFKVEK